MEQTIEAQLLKILNKVSLAERTKNRALERQASRLFKALFHMKSIVSSSKMFIAKKEQE